MFINPQLISKGNLEEEIPIDEMQSSITYGESVLLANEILVSRNAFLVKLYYFFNLDISHLNAMAIVYNNQTSNLQSYIENTSCEQNFLESTNQDTYQL